jgi:hypothetical protein
MTMNTARFLTMSKRFFGPIICVTFVWLAFRWVAALFKFAQLWPWCEFSPPPAQAYVLAVIGGISFGVAPLWLLAVFANIVGSDSGHQPLVDDAARPRWS